MTHYKRRLGVRFRKLREEHYLAFRSNAYRINELGAFVWAALEEPRSLDELVERILSAYDVEREQATGDCRRFLSFLLEAELVTEG